MYTYVVDGGRVFLNGGHEYMNPPAGFPLNKDAAFGDYIEITNPYLTEGGYFRKIFSMGNNGALLLRKALTDGYADAFVENMFTGLTCVYFLDREKAKTARVKTLRLFGNCPIKYVIHNENAKSLSFSSYMRDEGGKILCFDTEEDAHNYLKIELSDITARLDALLGDTPTTKDIEECKEYEDTWVEKHKITNIFMFEEEK